MTITITALQKQRRDTASNWTTNNTVLLAGEWGIESDTKKFKIGYVPQYGGFFNDLTLHDNLKAISEIVIDNKLKANNPIIFKICIISVNEEKL